MTFPKSEFAALSSADDNKRKMDDATEDIIVTPYISLVADKLVTPNRNMIRFTPKQIEAIRSGTSQGLSLIVGPPGIA